MDLNKKGILFTLIALLLSSLFIILYTTDIRTPIDNKIDLYSMRAQNIRNYQDNLQQYTKYALEIGGYQALKTLIEYEAYTGTPYNTEQNISCQLADVLMDGVLSERIYADAQDPASPGIPIYLHAKILASGGIIIFDHPLSTGELVLDATSGTTNNTNSTLMRFKPSSAGLLNNVTLGVENSLSLGDATVNVTIYLDRCNQIFPLDFTTLTIPDSSPMQERTFYSTKNAYLDPGNWYVLEITSNKRISIKYYTLVPSDASNLINATAWHNYTNDLLTKKQSLTNYLQAIYQLSSQELALDGNFTIYNLNISHASSFELNLTADILYTVTDNHTTYTRHTEISSPISIADLPEPLLAVNLNRTRPIREAPFNVDARWNLSVLTNFTMENYTWSRYEKTPSFIYRMLNWTNTSGNYGIETVLPNYRYAGNRTNMSYVDWQFLNNTYSHCSQIMAINNTLMETQGIYPPEYIEFWGKNNGTTFDIDTLVTYQVNNTYWNTTCTE